MNFREMTVTEYRQMLSASTGAGQVSTSRQNRFVSAQAPRR